MTTAYSWTEQIDTLDAGGAVTATESKRHTWSQADTDGATYVAGRVAEQVAIQAGLRPGFDAIAQGRADQLAASFGVAFAGILDGAVAPAYITGPGHYAQDAAGNLLSMDAAGGVYSNGQQMAGIAAAKLAIVGKSIYGLGKTVPSWWRWTGSTWAGPITNGDPNILK